VLGIVGYYDSNFSPVRLSRQANSIRVTFWICPTRAVVSASHQRGKYSLEETSPEGEAFVDRAQSVHLLASLRIPQSSSCYGSTGGPLPAGDRI